MAKEPTRLLMVLAAASTRAFDIRTLTLHWASSSPFVNNVLWQTVKTRMKCRIMRHFIMVFTVC